MSEADVPTFERVAAEEQRTISPRPGSQLAHDRRLQVGRFLLQLGLILLLAIYLLWFAYAVAEELGPGDFAGFSDYLTAMIFAAPLALLVLLGPGIYMLARRGRTPMWVKRGRWLIGGLEGVLLLMAIAGISDGSIAGLAVAMLAVLSGAGLLIAALIAWLAAQVRDWRIVFYFATAYIVGISAWLLSLNLGDNLRRMRTAEGLLLFTVLLVVAAGLVTAAVARALRSSRTAPPARTGPQNHGGGQHRD